MKPITPRQAREADKKFPDYVIEAFNELIVQNLKNGEAKVLQDEALDLIEEKGNVSREHIFDNNLLDVESTFEKAGWEVEYSKSDYYETAKAYFIFKMEPK